ncbi:hypothetical protein [Granulicella sp. dw_53]|uniref:hypothetical protein n=1 Tax=Granulicella sp. dw_53 TaxID=2719792 RepID=UPI001BD24478|nr:hypothetical protein [Granulicella sp. dw_53]
MKHFSEEDLIAYQLHEGANEGEIRRHLEECVVCAAMSDAIAETLRVFSAEPVPAPDVERNWQWLRGNLTVLEAAPRRRFGLLRAGWVWGSAGLVAAALLVVVALFGVHVRRQVVPKPNYAINGRGPLTTRPADPAIANHLDAAERLLTEVNHASGPLDNTMRSQAHNLLLKNAVYVHTAHEQGDVAEAAVLDNLGRVLTTIDHTSDGESEHRTLQLRVEMNTDGLLLDLRILRQNGQVGQ